MSGSDPFFNSSPSDDHFRSEDLPEFSPRPELGNPLNSPLFSNSSSKRARSAEESRDPELVTRFRHFLVDEQYSLYEEMGDELKVLARQFVKRVSHVIYRDMKRAGISDPSIDIPLESCGIRVSPEEHDSFVVQGFFADQSGNPILIGYGDGLERTTAGMSAILLGNLAVDEVTSIPQLSRGAERELIMRDQPSWVWAQAIHSAIRQKIERLVEKKEIDAARVELFDIDRLFHDDKVEIHATRVEVLLDDEIYDFVLGTDRYRTPQCAEFSP